MFEPDRQDLMDGMRTSRKGGSGEKRTKGNSKIHKRTKKMSNI